MASDTQAEHRGGVERTAIRRHDLVFAQQLGLLDLILRVSDNAGIFGLLQINQLLSDGGGFWFAGGAASDRQTDAAGKECHS